jgi:hypothetical protein
MNQQASTSDNGELPADASILDGLADPVVMLGRAQTGLQAFTR